MNNVASVNDHNYKTNPNIKRRSKAEETYIKNQRRPGVIDHNYRGDVRLHYEDESLWNNMEAEQQLKNILQMEKIGGVKKET